MSAESFIAGKRDEANHAGRHSTLQRLQASMAEIATWKHGRASAHESGEDPDPLPYMPEGEGTEIELFATPEVTPYTDTFQSTWDRVRTFKDDRTQMPSDLVFHGGKGIEEAGELKDAIATGNLLQIFGEWADVGINWMQTAQALKISPSLALIVMNAKLEELEERYPVEVFNGSNGLCYEENYANAKRGRDQHESS